MLRAAGFKVKEICGSLERHQNGPINNFEHYRCLYLDGEHLSGNFLIEYAIFHQVFENLIECEDLV